MKVRTKSKKVNKAWLNDHLNDPYVKLAQKEGYRARAAYKLKEIDQALGLIKPGHLVVDLGSTPGAWSQYVRRKLAPEGAAAEPSERAERRGERQRAPRPREASPRRPGAPRGQAPATGPSMRTRSTGSMSRPAP